MKAFPTAFDDGINAFQHGMDLRDYFAAKAMQGLLAADPSIPLDVTDEIGLLAKAAYDVADAMLKAR